MATFLENITIVVWNLWLGSSSKEKFSAIFFQAPPLCQLVLHEHSAIHTHWKSWNFLNFFEIAHDQSRVTVQKLNIVDKKFKYNSNRQGFCLHFKVWMVSLGQSMPEQEMFEKVDNFAIFLTLSHSFLMGNLSQFFATYVAKNLYFGEKSNSNPSQNEPHVLMYFLCVCDKRCGTS